MTDNRETRTYGEPMPLHSQRATYDGYRSVRLLNDDIGLATTAYSYKLSYDEVQEAAERIALMWNLHLGESVEQLRLRYLDAPPAPSPHLVGECPECNGTGEIFCHADDCHDDLCALNGDGHSCSGKVEPCGCSLPSQHVALPQDVINLVIAAREFWEVAMDDSDESAALDAALEAFASRVPYENEPDAPEDPAA